MLILILMLMLTLMPAVILREYGNGTFSSILLSLLTNIRILGIPRASKVLFSPLSKPRRDQCLIAEPVGIRGEKTASAMETQLTALERKIDDLLATVANAEAPGSMGGQGTSETVDNVTATSEDQSEEKMTPAS